MAAFGLYTHIQANRRRSVALIVGLFVLVYVLTFAFALLFRALELGPPRRAASGAGLPSRRGPRLSLWLSPVVTAATALWVWAASRFHQGLIDAVTGSEGVSLARTIRGSTICSRTSASPAACRCRT
jgi:heat shock protein HtpX